MTRGGSDIVTSGLILYLDAANKKSYPGTGTAVYDLSNNGHNATLINGVSDNPTGLTSFSFDGIDDYISLGNTSTLGFTSGMFTVSSWFYIPSTWTTGAQYPNLFGKGASAGWDNNGWTIYIFRNYGYGTGYAVGYGVRNSSNINICTVYNMPANVPINVVVTVGADLIQVYINGVLSGEAARTVDPGANSYDVRIASGPGGIYFPGYVYNVMAYNTVLNEPEIVQNYIALKGRFGL